MLLLHTLVVGLVVLPHQIVAFATDDCKSYSVGKLWSLSSTLANQVDDLLVPSSFERVVSGSYVLTVDEDDGISAGGGTNTFGSYGTFYFDGNDILPEGVCEQVPSSDGTSSRCIGPRMTTSSFMIGPADVIVFVSCTPPPMRYFSYDLIISTRLTETYPFYPGQNFLDPISNLYINISMQSENETVFDQPFILILAVDSNAADIVANAYIDLGFNRESINVLGIDSNIVRLNDRSLNQSWDETKPDILSFISRMTLPNDDSETAYTSYKKIVWPVHYYFASDDKSLDHPIDVQHKPRYSDQTPDEVTMMTDGILYLEQAILDKWVNQYGMTQQGFQALNLTAEGYYDDWDVVLNRKNNDSFAAACRDAIYGLPISLESSSLHSNTMAVVFGIIHSDVLNALYSSVGVDVTNSFANTFYETHWFYDTQLQGSASRYFMNEQKAEHFYAIDFFFPGGCSIEPSAWCVEFNQSSMRVTNKLALGERVYGIRDTSIGPYGYNVIPAKLLIFRNSAIL